MEWFLFAQHIFERVPSVMAITRFVYAESISDLNGTCGVPEGNIAPRLLNISTVFV